MKINQKLDHIVVDDGFIENYLQLHGVDNVYKYMNPTWDCIEPPENYDNMAEGKELLEKHLGGKIGVLVDKDGDGIFSSVLIYNFIGDISRLFFHDGKLHGLGDEKVYKEICESGIDLLIIPDAGSNDYEQHKELKEKYNIDILVTDHHSAERYSDHAVVINNQLSPNVINKDATGTTVTWQFCRYLDEEKAKKYIDLCAFATVSDVVDVTSYENRAILYYGLENINNPLLVAMVKEFNKGVKPTQNDLGWVLIPKISSLIRTDNVEDDICLFDAMTTPDITMRWKKGVRAKEEEWTVLDRVVEQCKTSQKKQSDMAKKFMESIDPELDTNAKIIIGFAGDDLGGGYTGLVAGKISDKYNKPCLLLRDRGDSYTGSLRSGVDLRSILDDSEHTDWCQGHEKSAGIQIPKASLNDFKAFISTLDLSDDPVHDVLYSFEHSSIPDELFGLIEHHKELFGKGLPSPLFHIKPFQLNSSQIMMMGNNTTLKIPLGNLSAIKFFCSKKIREDFYVGEYTDIEVELIVELSVNYWGDGKYNQFLIKDYSVKKTSPKISWDDLI
jgi:single-stranded-DNA-specific exonuclease